MGIEQGAWGWELGAWGREMGAWGKNPDSMKLSGFMTASILNKSGWAIWFLIL